VFTKVASSTCDEGHSLLCAVEEVLFPEHFALVLEKLLSTKTSDTEESQLHLMHGALHYMDVLDQTLAAKLSDSESDQKSKKKKKKK
ncbi:hypothetical protein PMAYCL1PPCAC_25015, partial [Pristionchus mayeri]